jgi:adenosylcobinamide kinase/adenosylcobinamide-phosphate guanylyltransferase
MLECHLILGGARSGKSRFAEQTAHALYRQTRGATLVYLATATAEDSEMESRIAHHQQRRGEEWQLIEEPLDIANVIDRASDGTTILIDCLTLWLSNCLHRECWPQRRDEFLQALNTTKANVILVSNEVGSGIVPMGELSRQFVDESGWLHQQIAKQASDVTLVVAGLKMSLKQSPRA